MGTDTGPGGRFQGYFEQLEMEMMVEGGMDPLEVLRSATGRAARCIGMDHVLGTVRPGLWADFVVLDTDLRKENLNTRAIHGVWIAGNRLR
jgi:imidazolonepropionase-like amidohydrolase